MTYLDLQIDIRFLLDKEFLISDLCLVLRYFIAVFLFDPKYCLVSQGFVHVT